MPQVQPPLHSITDLKPGDHACFIYGTDEEHRNFITPFLRKGLEQNEKVVYIADARDPGTIINYLKTDGFDIEHYQKKGQFSILNSTDTYLKGGVFGPDGMMAILSSDTQKALDEGYTALRVTAEMSWALQGLPGSERLIEYEDKADTFITGSKFLAICQYDRRCFSRELLHDVLTMHPFAVIGTSVYNNSYYVPLQERMKENRSGIQPNSRTSNPVDHNTAGKLLRESEEKYRTLVENIQDGVYILDCQGTFQFVNDEIVHRSGYSAEWFIGRHYLDVISPEYQKTAQRFFGMVMAGRNPPIYEVAYPIVSGALFYVELKTSPIFKNNNVAGLLGISRDINERKWAEDALRESEETFKALAENANDGILVAVGEGVHIYANRRACEITGYSVAELLKTSIKDLAAPDEVKKLIERFRKRLSGEDVPHQYETVIIRKDGKSVPIEFTAAKTSWHGQPADLVTIRDITDRRRAEEALRKSEEKYRGLIEQTGEGVWIIDREYRTTFVNNRLAAMFGYTPQEMTGKEIREFMPAGDMEIHSQRIRERMEGESDRFEQKFFRKDGSVLWTIASVTPLLAEENRLVGAFAMLTDITDRKRMEEALRKSELDLREAQRVSHVGSWDLNVVTGDLQWSDECYRIYGFRPQEFMPTYEKFRSIVHPEDLGFVQEQVDAALNNDKHYTIDFRFVRPDGINGWIHCEGEVTRDAEGKPLRFFGTQIDITDRKRTDEALRFVQEKYTKAFFSAPDAITISELDSGRFAEVNEAATTIFGYSREELIGKSAFELGIWQKKEDRAAFVDEIREHGRVYQYEAVERRKSGELFNAMVNADTLSIGGVTYLIAIIRDITERKRAEEQLKHFNEELESQVRSRTVELERLNILLRDEVIQRIGAEERVLKSLNERDLLLREVHHRVRNNLQIMLSLIRLQSRNIKDPRLLDPLGEFQNRIKAMAHVHERMYRAEDISRIDLSEIVTSLGTSLFKSYKVDPQHIRLNVEMKDLQITIESAIPLSLIINELISNSIKHAFPKGTTGEITIAGRREADTLVLSVRDTGIGIPEDLDWMRSKQSIGHRLVAILVEQLNGTIELDRTTGTAFNIVVKEKP